MTQKLAESVYEYSLKHGPEYGACKHISYDLAWWYIETGEYDGSSNGHKQNGGQRGNSYGPITSPYLNHPPVFFTEQLSLPTEITANDPSFHPFTKVGEYNDTRHHSRHSHQHGYYHIQP